MQQDGQATEIIGNNVRISGQNVCYNVLEKCNELLANSYFRGRRFAADTLSWDSGHSL